MRPFEPWMLGIIDGAGYNGLTDEHIQRVADEILKMGITNVSRADFERACRLAFVAPENFGDDDIARLEELLNR